MANERKKKGEKPLTKRQKAFVEAMANPQVKTVTKAAEIAGYAPSTASVDAYRILENPRISSAIQNRINRAMRHHQVTPEEVLGSAVFNMRASMDDLMDEEGFFDLEKARETGAIDLIKEIEFDQSVDLETGTRKIRHKVKFESPAAARKEVANYIGLENFENKQPVTDEEMFVVLFNRILAKGQLSPEEIVLGLKRQERFKNIDEAKLLNA